VAGNCCANWLTSQEELNMTIRLGDIAPNFTAPTTLGDIDFHTWK